jgi:isoleucyl-tRNA synthetase
MSTKFTEYKGMDLPTSASEILDFWKNENIFEKSVTTREGNQPYVFFEGPPSANGLPGIHHVMARAIKDIFCRYKTQKGFQVKRKAGWDTHGLPVELGTEKELGITKEDIGKLFRSKNTTKPANARLCATPMSGTTLPKKWAIGSIWKSICDLQIQIHGIGLVAFEADL